MRYHRPWLAGLGLLCFAGLTRLALADPTPCTPPKHASGHSVVAVSAKVLAARIDALIDARLVAEKVKPAPLADDAEFVRRLYLDLAGKIPPESVAYDFLDPT